MIVLIMKMDQYKYTVFSNITFVDTLQEEKERVCVDNQSKEDNHTHNFLIVKGKGGTIEKPITKKTKQIKKPL